MSQPAPARIGQRLEAVDTPALILELAAFERNQKTLFDLVKGRVRVRPLAGWNGGLGRGLDGRPAACRAGRSSHTFCRLSHRKRGWEISDSYEFRVRRRIRSRRC